MTAHTCSLPREDRTRVYPSCCTSAFCGREACAGCRHEPVLAAFKAWRERTKAVVTDPIWCPTVWTATRGAP